MKINWTVVVSIVALVLVVAVGIVTYNLGYTAGNQAAVNIRAEFFQARLGNQAQNTGTDTAPAGTTGQSGAQGQRAAQFGRLAAAGTVKSVQGNKIEVTTQNGNVVTVTVDQQTQFIKTVVGLVSDLQPGTRIQVMSDQTGSAVNARLITIQAAGGGAQTP